MRIADCGLRKYASGLCWLLLFMLGITLCADAEGVQPKITVEPATIYPGDIAVITVKNTAGPVDGTFRGKPLHFNPSQGAFKAILGIDLYTEPKTYPLVLAINGTEASRNIVISKKKFPLQRLTLPKDLVILSPENEARVEHEQKKTASLWPVDSLRIWTGVFMHPMPNRKIGTPFGVRRIINKIPKNSHSGVDITAAEGEPVLAPNDGVAVLVDDQFYSGKSIILDHGQGIYTMFFHLSKINVRYGQAVMKGDVIGLVGSTGRSSGAHLHWGVRMQGARVDPIKLIHLKLE